MQKQKIIKKVKNKNIILYYIILMITEINVKKDANPSIKNEKKQIKKQINLMMNGCNKMQEM